VTIVKWISYLESVDSIGTSLFSDFLDLSRKKSVLVHTVVVLNSLAESHCFARNKEVTLFLHSFNLWVFDRPGSKSLGRNFLLSVIEELWLLDDGEDIVGNGLASDGDSLLSFECLLLFG